MAHQLLILGNGFDLHCGLKSSYNDFFRQTILDTVGENYGLIQARPHVNGFWEGLLLKHYEVSLQSNYNWCDIETIIKESLMLICFGSKAPDFSFPHKDGIWQNALKNNETPEIQRSTIQRYLFERCKYFYNEYLREVSAEKSGTKKLAIFLNYLLLELHNFERGFCKYIKNNIINPANVNELNVDYILKAANLLAALTGSTKANYRTLDDLRCNNNAIFHSFRDILSTHVLNFNYTALPDIIKTQDICYHINVHGKLCNEQCGENCTKSSIIFGIDDKIIQSRDEYAPLRLFSKTYRKMMLEESPLGILPHAYENLLEIKFYGHSLSEADYSYFQSIFDYYNLYGNNNVSLIFCYSEGYDQTDAVYRLVNSYGRTLTNKDQGKNLIHKLLLENRLIIKKID